MSGSPNTKTPTPTINAGHKTRRAKVTIVAGGYYEYLGYAPPGVGTDEKGWQVIRNTYDASNEFTATDYADGTDDFIKIWDNYATYTYS